MFKDACEGRPARRPWITALLAAGLALLMGVDTTGMILHSITIDGNVSDWGDVLTDPENVVADAGSFSSPPDPDLPGTADRDLRGVAFTWDATNLYLFFRRTLSGNSAFEFFAYVDLAHDGRLGTTDRVIRLSYNGASFTGGSIRQYVPVDGVLGDPITGDGVDEPGSLGTVLPGTPTSANSPDGIEFEAAVPWTALGVPAGTCMWIHPAIGRGANLPSQIEDNADPLDTQDVQVSLAEDHAGSGPSPGQVDYAHVACNEGSCSDVIELMVRSGNRWRVQIFSDPDGDGDPSDGALLGTDGNGDGDYSDDRDGDVLQPGADSNGNGVVDTGSLSADQCFRYVVRVFIPPGVAAGTTDVESVRARSATRSNDLERNTDRTHVGPITVFDDEDVTGFAGDLAWLPHVACNHQAFPDTIGLSASSALGWTVQVFSDPNGDGDPSDAAPIATVGPLAPGQCASVFVRATIPPGALAGAIDQVTLTGTSQASASVTESALDTITVVAERFSLAPNHDRDAGPGNVLFLPHVITNHQGGNDSFQLTAISADPSYTVIMLSDPDGDGEPDDSSTIAGGSIVGPVDRNGGEYHFLVRVDVPAGAVIGSTNTITVTARSQADTTRTDVATDIIRIRRILTYSDPLFARPSKTFFTGCSQVYVQAHGLQTNREYRFVWSDPSPLVQRTSPAYGPDARGRADDAFALPCGPLPGDWTIQLQQRSGSSWNDVADALATFTTLDPALDGGDITSLETDQASYDRDGDDLNVEAAFDNDTEADYGDTFADYVVFMDQDGNGEPTPGEPFILADGTRSTWDPGEQTHRTDPIEILSSDTFDDFWRVAGAQFDLEGTWCVEVRWIQRCNGGSCSEIEIDSALTCFLVSCLPAPVVDAGAAKSACAGFTVALADSASDGDTHSWSDGGAGGTFSPSATVLHPTWLAPGPGSYVLTLLSTFTATGCTTQDTVAVTIHPNPVADAGPALTTCAGDAVAIAGATSNADTHAWSDGGAGGSFSPSESVLNPSYTPPDPSPGSITLTLASSFAATGCSLSDSTDLTVNPNPVVSAGPDATTCAGDGITLTGATSTGDTHAWSDGGAGGSFTPSGSVLNPTYAPPDPAPSSITLTLTSSFAATGCDTSDALALTVNVNPVITAGADATTCAGDGIVLADASSTGDTHAWSDGGAGGDFLPSGGDLNPTYVPPDPAPPSITLTLVSTHSATGCDSVDALALTVDPNPVMSAGADATTCAGDGIALADATSDADVHAWSDGGLGGTFTPSASVLNPTYAPPDPSPASITLTLTSTFGMTGCDTVDTLALTVNPNPVATAGTDKTTCAGDGVPLADAASDGDTHAWSDGGAGGTFTPSAAALNPTYAPPDPSPASITLTLTSSFAATGCDTVESLALTVNPNPVTTAGADTTTCAGDAVTLADAASDADTHAWSDGGAGGTFAPSASALNPDYTPPDPSPASITLTLTSSFAATGCDTVDVLTLTVNPNPVVTAGADATTCAGDAVVLADAASDADTHAWSDGGAGGAFTPSASALNPTYTPPDPSPSSIMLTLTSSFAATGCDTVDALTLTVDANPVATAGPDTETCAGDAVALSGASSDADTHAWSDGGAGGTFTPSAAVLNPDYAPPDPSPASITLTLTSSFTATGCDTVDALALTVSANPVVDAGADATACAGEPVSLGDAASTGDIHSWSDGGAGGSFAPSASALNPDYTPPDPSPASITLTLTSSVAATGCDSSDSRLLTVNPNPAVTAGSDKSACAGDAVALSDADGGAADTFAWSDGGAGGTFSPSASVENPSYSHATPGVRILTFTASVAATGCSGEDEVTVTVNARPSVEAGAPKEGCAGADVALSDATSDGASVSWSDGGAGGTFTPSSSVLNPAYRNAATGSYTLTLTATSSAGCTASDTLGVTILPVPVAAFATPPGPICEDQPVCFDNASTGGTTWSWSFGDPSGGTSTDFEPCYSYSQPGTYTVTLTATNSCGSDVETRSVTIAPKPVADFSYDTVGNRFCRDKDVDFTDLSTNSPTSWTWDFGDGTTSTLQNPVHQYATDGVFIVSLVACNSCGCSAPRYRAVEIAASCNTNCEANSNQIACETAPATITGDTCTSHDNFNTTSYQCAPGILYSGENKSYDLNFAAGSNFIIRIIETVAEPNGYDLDLIVSDECNPPDCVSWGDTEVTYDDRTVANDDFFLVVDGRDGSCGPYRLEIECLDPLETAQCTAPDFDGILSATDENTCLISGILVTWAEAGDWGLDENGVPCPGGTYEIWRAPSDDPSDETRVGTAFPPATTFLDVTAVPGTEYVYEVHAINTCCGEAALTTATATATDLFGDEPVVADAGPDRVLTCAAPTATLLGSADGGTGAGFTWSWSPVAGLSDPNVPNPTVSQIGTYTLTVTDAGNGCADTDTVTVTGSGPPVASAGEDRQITCAIPVVTLDGSASGGDPSAGRTFSWSPSGPLSDASSATPQTSTEGTYTLTVTDAATGCSSSDAVTVTRNDAPPSAGAGPDKVITCDAPSAVLDGTASGGDGSAGYTYSWTPASGLDDPTVPSPVASTDGTWTLVVTAIATGCASAPDTVTVTRNDTPPVAGAGPDRLITCTAPEVTLDGSASGGDGSLGYAFAWSPPENVSDPSAEDPTTIVAGTYTVTVTDLATGCVATDVAEVTLDPGIPVADAGPDKDITCLVGSVLLEGSASGGDSSAGYAYHWEPAADVSDPDVAQPTTSVPGAYTLTVTTIADGCQVTDVVVVVDETAPPVTSAGPDTVLTCAATSVTLQGSASGNDGRDGFDYAWSPAGQVSDPAAPQPVTSTPGTYTLTVTDRYTGCTSTDDVVVTEDVAAPVAGAGADKHVDCTVPVVTLDGTASGGNGSAGYSFAWSPAAGLSDPSIATPTTSTAGTWTLTVTDLANGCEDTDVVSVTADTAAPAADAGPDRVIDCVSATVVLQGSASGGNGSLGYGFAWEPAAQVSDPALPDPTTSTPGTYTLTVTDLANGCTDSDTVLVTANVAVPVASAGPDLSLTCTTAIVTLQGSASGGDGSLGYDFEWAPAAQVSDPFSPTPTTSTPGSYTVQVTDRANGCTDIDTTVVLQDVAAPVADAGADKRVDCTTPIVTLDGAASGGNGSAGYSFAWTPAAGLSDPDVATPTTSSAGTWTLTVTDLANGCIATDAVSVTADTAAPSADAGADKSLDCVTTSVTLDGAASGGNGSLGYDFAWTPAAGLSDPATATPTATTGGTFTLTITDRANGCTDTDTVTVTASQAVPTASAGPDRAVTCATSVVTLQGSASGGDGSLGYDFAWSPAAGLSDPAAATPTTSTPGTYVLTVTDRANGCTATDAVDVAEDRTPPVASAGPDKVITCTTSTVILEGSASGGNGSAGYTFRWAPTGGLNDPNAARPTASIAGTWTLTVTDAANGCTATDTVTVTEDRRPPDANAGPDLVIDCRSGGSVTLQGSASGGNGSAGYAYRWAPAIGLSNPNSPTPSAIIARTYTLTVTDLANGCTDTDTMTVTRDERAPAADAGAGGTLTCNAPEVQLLGTATGGNGSLGYAFSWTPAAGLSDPAIANPLATAPGTYTLTVTDTANGCTDTDTVTVLDNRTPPVVSAGPDVALDCTTTMVTLLGSASGGDGSAGYGYSWSPPTVSNPSAPQPTTSTPGTYTLTVTDLANGCVATDDVVVSGISAPPPVADAGPDGRVTCAAPDAPLVGSATGGDGSLGYTAAWSPVTGVADPAAFVTTTRQAGTFTLTVTDVATGCKDTDTVVIADGRIPPVADAGADLLASCESPGTLPGAASGGDGSLGYAFRWEPAADVSDPDVAQPTTTIPGDYTLTVTDVATGCVSADVVTVGPLPVPSPLEPSDILARPAAPPLLVRWVDPSTRTQLLLTWEDVGAFADALHEGSISALGPGGGAYDHAPAACDLPTSSATLARPTGDRYFIAVAVNCAGGESSYGRNSLGAERPDSAAASGATCP